MGAQYNNIFFLLTSSLILIQVMKILFSSFLSHKRPVVQNAKQKNKSGSNSRQAGAPDRKILLDLNHLDEAEEDIINRCKNENTKILFLQFINDMRKDLINVNNVETQTDDVHVQSTSTQTCSECDQMELGNVDQLLHLLSELETDEDNIFVFQNMVHMQSSQLKLVNILQAIQSMNEEEEICFFEAFLNEKSMVENLLKIFSSQNIEAQLNFYRALGGSLNQSLYEASEKNRGIADKSIEDLNKDNLSQTFEDMDLRLKTFLDAATERSNHYYPNREKVEAKKKTQICNAYDALLKARNSKYLSLNGVKEHLICFISSGRSVIVSEMISQIGGKGNRRVIEEIIKNSEISCQFEEPQNVVIFVSFDNIQKLSKTHRLTSKDQEKVYAVVVTSILATLPDGYRCNQIQFQASHSPSAWYTAYHYNEETDVFCQKLDSDVLKECINDMYNDEKVIDEYFEAELQTELENVYKDLNEELKDSVDIKLEKDSGKKIRL